MPNFMGYYPLVAGKDVIIDVGQGGLGGLLIGNESGLSCVVKMGGNYSRSLYPGWVDYFPLPGNQFTGVVTITPSVQLNNVASWPGAYAQVDAFGLHEHVGGTYPAPLVRNANVGNTVATVGGVATAIQNDKNGAGTVIAEATVLSDPTSSVTLTNDGQMTLGSGTRNGSLHITNSAGVNDWQVDTSGIEHTRTQQPPGASGIHFNDQFGTEQMVVGGPNAALEMKLAAPAVALKFLVGSITRISMFSGSAPNVSTPFNHGLGVVPDMVLLTLTGTNNTASMVKYDASSLTSTQVSIVSDSSRAFVGLAIKF